MASSTGTTTIALTTTTRRTTTTTTTTGCREQEWSTSSLQCILPPGGMRQANPLQKLHISEKYARATAADSRHEHPLVLLLLLMLLLLLPLLLPLLLLLLLLLLLPLLSS